MVLNTRDLHASVTIQACPYPSRFFREQTGGVIVCSSWLSFLLSSLHRLVFSTLSLADPNDEFVPNCIVLF